MKFTEIAIEDFHGCHNIRLPQLTGGLNIVYAPNQSIRSSLREFVTSILYGPRDQAECSSPLQTDACSIGHIHVNSAGKRYRLARPRSSSFGQLLVSDLGSVSFGVDETEFLTELDRESFESFFSIKLGLGLPVNFVAHLVSRFEVAVADAPINGKIEEYEHSKAVAERRISQLQQVRRDIERLGQERERLKAQSDDYRTKYRDRLADLDGELADYQAEANSKTIRLNTYRSQLFELDQEIKELNQTIESTRQSTFDVTSNPHQLVVLFHRMDEIDDQIRRWRRLQSDIQQQRVRLRDEMVTSPPPSIQSSEHPYHRASEILSRLDSKVEQTQQHADSCCKTNRDPNVELHRLDGLCNEMREELRTLCDELSRQYKHVRHKTAAAELKQLRRCYQEMDENINRLFLRRDTEIEHIRQFDPSGADAILRADQQFCDCAENEGYLTARRRFVPDSIPFVWEEPNRNNDGVLSQKNTRDRLQQRQTELQDQIATFESDLRNLESKRDKILDERNSLAVRSIGELEDRIRQLDLSQTSLIDQQRSLEAQTESDKRLFDWKPSFLLDQANRYLHQLTSGSLQQIWIDRANTICLRTQSGDVHTLGALNRQYQDEVLLSIAFAAADEFARRDIRYPILIQDDTGSQEKIHTLLPALEAICKSAGHQIILLAGSRRIAEFSRQYDASVFELADTNITAPTWYPDVPAVPRQDFPESIGSDYFHWTTKSKIERSELNPIPIEETSAALKPNSLRHRAHNVGYGSITNWTNSISRDISLGQVDLVESIYIRSLRSLGIETVGQLLDLDVTDLDADLIRRGFHPEQIDRWQCQTYLLMCLPQLSTSEARVLVGSGIDDPEMILELSESEFISRINRFLETSAGRRSNADSSQFTSSRLRNWSEHLRENDSAREMRRIRRRLQRRREHSGQVQNELRIPDSKSNLRKHPQQK